MLDIPTMRVAAGLPADGGLEMAVQTGRVTPDKTYGIDPAKSRLGWEPTTTVEQLAKMMVDHDMEAARREKTLRDAGHRLSSRNVRD